MDRVTDIATLMVGVVLPFVAFIAFLLIARALMDRWQARHADTPREDEAQTYPALPALPSEPMAANVVLWDAHRWADHTRGGDAA
jgi:hypothetical protein